MFSSSVVPRRASAAAAIKRAARCRTGWGSGLRRAGGSARGPEPGGQGQTRHVLRVIACVGSFLEGRSAGVRQGHPGGRTVLGRFPGREPPPH